MLTTNLKRPFFSKRINEEVKKIEDEKVIPINKIENLRSVLIIVGANIRAIRKVQKKTISELASFARISAKYLQGVEVGKRNISITNLNKIAKVLDMPVGMFFRDDNIDKTKKLLSIASRLKNYSPNQLNHIEDLIRDVDNIIDK